MNFISFDCGIVTFAHITGTVNSLTFDPILKIISNADVSIRDLATTNLNTIKLPEVYPNLTLKLLSALKIHLDNITRELEPANTIAFIEQQMKISPDVYSVYAGAIMYLLAKGFTVQVVGATVKNKYSFNSKLTNEFHQINGKSIKAHTLNNFTYYLDANHPSIYRAINKTQAYLVHISDAFMQMICFTLEHVTYYPQVKFTQIKYIEAATLISIAPTLHHAPVVDNKSVLDSIVKKISKEKKPALNKNTPATNAASSSDVLYDMFIKPAPTPHVTPLIPVVDIPPGGIDLNIVTLDSNPHNTTADIIALMTVAIDREIDEELTNSATTGSDEPAFKMDLQGDYFAIDQPPALIPLP